MPYLGHFFSPLATPQAKRDGRIDRSSIISLLRLKISKNYFGMTVLLFLWSTLHKKMWTPKEQLEGFRCLRRRLVEMVRDSSHLLA
jgi:hypothetical protein